MKPKFTLLTCIGLLLSSFIAPAQDNPPAAPPAAPAPQAAEAAAAPPAAPAPQPGDAPAAPPAAPAPQPGDAPAAPPPAAPAPQPGEAPAATPAAPAPQAAAAAPGAPEAVIPLIQYVDVPLTTAIENLARQANRNYILDPKVGYGQLGPDGKPVPQPSISVRWENLTPDSALNAMLNNYDLQIVEDPKSKVWRISKKDPAAPDPIVTKIIQLKFANTSNMVTAVQATLSDKRSKVVADNRTSQLVVLATEKEMISVDELVTRLDTQSKQVLIEAQLMEVSMSPSTAKGINWAGTFKQQNVTFGNGAVGQANTAFKAPGSTTTTTLPGGRTVTTTSPYDMTTVVSSGGGSGGSSGGSGGGGGGASGALGGVAGGSVLNGFSANTLAGLTPAIGFLNADGLKATLSFFNEQADTKILSTPRTVTVDNEPTYIEVGTMYPIVNVTAGTVQTAGGSQISYTNLTLRLDVTPSISANDFVNLRVHPTVLRLGPKVATVVNNQVNNVDSFFKRDIETKVLIPSGNTLVLGGLVTDELNNSSTKVPVLGDLPLLGYAFQSKSKARDKSNLIVFITPTIVKDDDFQPAATAFLKTPRPASDDAAPDWTTWDSTTPKDWSKPEKVSSSTEPAPTPVFDESLVAPKQ